MVAMFRSAGGAFRTEFFGSVESFVGIYSGRTDDDQLGVQIGVVWKANVIEEILKAKVTGSNPLPP
jgi:hypothetical protein